MKTIGLIGGVSWQSTQLYYHQLNEAIQQRLGGHHSAKIIMCSLDFQELVRIANDDDRERVTGILCESAQALERAGADFFLLCSNTLHAFASQLRAATTLPFLSIVDTTACAVRKQNIKKVALLGTRYTMKQAFYKQTLHSKGLITLVPKGDDLKAVHSIIYDELVLGHRHEASKDRLHDIIHTLQERGAEGVILGCTELPLLVKPHTALPPLFDTTSLHVRAAINAALSKE